MTDPIDRAEALRVLKQAFDCEPRFDAEFFVYEQLTKAIRAIPAIGTCATCGWWDNPGIVRPGHGECHRWQYSTSGGYRCLLTSPDHYCATWQPQGGQV